MKTPKGHSNFFLGALLLFAVSIPLPSGLHAEATRKALSGRHRIELGFGLLSSIETDNYVVPGVVSSDVSIDGPAFSLSYAYWPDEQWNLSFRVVTMGVDASHNVSIGQVSTEASTVVPIIFAVGFQPKALAPSEGVRPFFSAGVGSFIGVRSSARTAPLVVTTDTRTESTFGAHFGAGVDCLLSRLISLRISGGYYLVSDFDEPVSGEKNYSTPEISVSLGFNFGRGK